MLADNGVGARVVVLMYEGECFAVAGHGGGRSGDGGVTGTEQR